MSGHYIETCIDCRMVISQCRCYDSNKEQRLGLCERCIKTRAERATCKAEPTPVPTCPACALKDAEIEKWQQARAELGADLLLELRAKDAELSRLQGLLREVAQSDYDEPGRPGGYTGYRVYLPVKTWTAIQQATKEQG